ncbi:E3 ubiquitin-protein ligase RHA2B-like [Olea europaea var. sylvestris]|uniref:E3 ubiquitin-protein ligase RHA2B-like n=1 Tax=Olea europaea var. sylvestris TaxID=158386 RepID=UPI000C1D6A16|nr:E3 ubiquitin-protein ligase RHA2B-like [Olea europaea var. sylvestris]
MGLQSQLSDVSSESILILLVVLIGKSARYLHSLLFTILHNLGFILPRSDRDRAQFENSFYDVIGSGLAGLSVLCEQLNLNRVLSYPNQSNGCARADLNCVVCLNQLGEGDHVRKLACGHVFHKECFDGWLDHLNFNCPLCRMPLVSDERVCSRTGV